MVKFTKNSNSFRSFQTINFNLKQYQPSVVGVRDDGKPWQPRQIKGYMFCIKYKMEALQMHKVGREMSYGQIDLISKGFYI